ncbi:MAG: 4-hydroxythreonine-4-phosphate dehydrogenase PdxA [Chloroflexi bacterium]|nr:4-hydroxythreonine-4-phosphate dehydrogenase PdxA [Chloroflexota bacterium]
MDRLPILAVTMGDPAGIGAEVIAKALPSEISRERSLPVVIGDLRVMSEAVRRWAAGWRAEAVESVVGLQSGPGDRIPVLDLGNCDPQKFEPGNVAAYTGQAAYEYVVRAASLALAKEADAMVTAPLNKEAMHLAGHKFDGHTGLLAELCGVKTQFMVLGSPRLKVIHLSTHVDLASAVFRVKKERVLECIRAGHRHVRQLGIPSPRIGVCGLNPHAGENRLFGNQDEDEVRPAVEAAIGEGIDARGPLPPDTAFRHAYEGKWDIVVALYHDQGHIPMKLIAFEDGVNVTVGLPIVRTSVDHGTAFDIAWKGVANPANMTAAIDYAYRLVTGAAEVG